MALLQSHRRVYSYVVKIYARATCISGFHLRGGGGYWWAFTPQPPIIHAIHVCVKCLNGDSVQSSSFAYFYPINYMKLHATCGRKHIPHPTFNYKIMEGNQRISPRVYRLPKVSLISFSLTGCSEATRNNLRGCRFKSVSIPQIPLMLVS